MAETQLIEVELNGAAIKVEPGLSILEVAIQYGDYVPHFCYHKKLSIAANCRMCLVEVEKSPKPLPACSTPVTEGMKIKTDSKLAVEAQKGVMELLLINHPLDCPICDQGGECQLQDLAVGYGSSASRFDEDKRVVSNKDLGPLISTHMTRCIHCSRCVRFTDEVGGYQELGMSYRNNHVEVMPFLGQTLNSEISGNIIDLCPVGALTSKPFAHSNRSWELSRRKGIAMHDGLGSNLIIQVDKYGRVARVLPKENEQLNECWISDRDRFSYEGLYHEDRITSPMIKNKNGKWAAVEWNEAIAYASDIIKNTISLHGANQIGALAHSGSTLEEFHALGNMLNSAGINNMDYRLHQSDFRDNDVYAGYIGSSVQEFALAKSLLVVGCNLRSEHPLLASRIRSSVKRGTELNIVNVVHEDLLCKTHEQHICHPHSLVNFLGQVLKAVSIMANQDIGYLNQIDNICDSANKIAKSLYNNKGHIILGAIAKSLPCYGDLVLLVKQIAHTVNGKYGIPANFSNEFGANLAGFLPCIDDYGVKGLNAQEMLDAALKTYILFNTELERDSYSAYIASKALQNAEFSIVFTAFTNPKMYEYASVILPIAPYVENSGTYVNMQGDFQSFYASTKPLGNALPGTKAIGLLNEHLGYKTTDELRFSIEKTTEKFKTITKPDKLNQADLIAKINLLDGVVLNTIVRLGVHNMYDIDSVLRRAKSLQQTQLALDKQVILVNANDFDAVKGVLESRIMLLDSSDDNITTDQFLLKVDNRVLCGTVLIPANINNLPFGRYDTIMSI